MMVLTLYSTLSANFILHVFKHLAKMKGISLLFYGQVSKAHYICF